MGDLDENSVDHERPLCSSISTSRQVTLVQPPIKRYDPQESQIDCSYGMVAAHQPVQLRGDIATLDVSRKHDYAKTQLSAIDRQC
jgi:hypothetical protein